MVLMRVCHLMQTTDEHDKTPTITMDDDDDDGWKRSVN